MRLGSSTFCRSRTRLPPNAAMNGQPIFSMGASWEASPVASVNLNCRVRLTVVDACAIAKASYRKVSLAAMLPAYGRKSKVCERGLERLRGRLAGGEGDPGECGR